MSRPHLFCQHLQFSPVCVNLHSIPSIDLVQPLYRLTVFSSIVCSTSNVDTENKAKITSKCKNGSFTFVRSPFFSLFPPIFPLFYLFYFFAHFSHFFCLFKFKIKYSLVLIFLCSFCRTIISFFLFIQCMCMFV